MARGTECLADCIVCCICPFAPVWLPLLYAYRCFRRHHPKLTPEEREHRAYYAEKPRPLPYRRKQLSNISLPLQEQSRLLNLPVEIRMRIYEYVLANRYIFHVEYDPAYPRRLVQFQCRYPPNWGSSRHLRRKGDPRFGSEMWIEDENVGLGLPKSCRQIYKETMPLLYGTNTFSVDSLDTLVFLNQTVPVHRLASIRYLQITWAGSRLPLVKFSDRVKRPEDDETWIRFWNIIATRLTGLEGLDVQLRPLRGEYREEKVWLAPLTRIRGLKHFVLDIEYQDYRIDEPTSRVDSRALNWRRELERAVKRPRNTHRWRARSFDRGRLRGREEAGLEMVLFRGKGEVERGRGKEVVRV